MDYGRGFTQRGDTHFCFLIPELTFEDQVVLQEALDVGLIRKRLAACLLTVDQWNPVFSPRREALLQHVPPTAKITNGKSRFSAEMAKRILAAAADGPAGSPEAEFAERWAVGSRFTDEFNRLLGNYYAAVTKRLKTQRGCDGYFQLAEERRQAFKKGTRIAGFPLLLPKTNIKVTGRRMHSDGAVAR